MFSHIVVGSNDRERSRRFYDALFAEIGGPLASDGDDGRLVYAHGGSLFMVVSPIDGAAATAANGGTIGFNAASAQQVDRWHAAGLATGGSNAADPPGPRQSPFGPIYLAYLRDPDGNKLAAAYTMAGSS
jgi:catechol 2,3-dioxygenase-like lactoylglutathione lyase family enzyme